MRPFGFLSANLLMFLGVALCTWTYYTSGHHWKSLDGKFEVRLPRDRSCTPPSYFEAEDRLRVQLRYDESGRLRRWVGGVEVGPDDELRAAIDKGRHPELDVPLGIDALRDMSWAEIVRTMGLCAKQGLQVTLVGPVEIPAR